MEVLLTSEGLLALLTLTMMEIVLGIDNVIFIAIIAERLPKEEQRKARVIGLSLALIVRVFLLSLLTFLTHLKATLFTVFSISFSYRDLILLAGGLFLIYKSASEIHHKLEGKDGDKNNGKASSFAYAIVQIIIIDVVFSLDSILTAIGLTEYLSVMILAVILSMIVMLLSAKGIQDFINKHPSVKVLALSFLLMIGMLLIIEGFHGHFDKNYIYFAMFFALVVEIINILISKRQNPVDLRDHISKDDSTSV